MIAWFHQYPSLGRALALLLFLSLLVTGALGGEHRLIRIGSATL
jgi:hypothetical protein